MVEIWEFRLLPNCLDVVYNVPEENLTCDGKFKVCPKILTGHLSGQQASHFGRTRGIVALGTCWYRIEAACPTVGN